MRAVLITELTGSVALQEVDVPEPEATHMLSPDGAVIIDVAAAGVSFPEVLQSRGEDRLKPELPFIPAAEVAGIVRSAPEGSAHQPGDRVAAMTMLGGFAETAGATDFLTCALADDLDLDQGAGLI